MNLLDKLRRVAKGLVAFAAPGAVLIGAAVTEASPGGSSITTAEWVTAAVTCVVTSAAVWRTPNIDTRNWS
ncbi:hypothetical protein [Nocardioides speluncae]|uniref:hypothetical protein n=1 Tax=Nocardioides speluncae TaxID=2670337 RepID=UPI000D69B8AF|nr:hypothetical protein [Nocardioides speluncae]